MADPNPEIDPISHSDSKFTNTKVILFAVFALSLIVMLIIINVASIPDRHSDQNDEPKSGKFTSSAFLASKIAGDFAGRAGTTAPPVAPQSAGLTGYQPQENKTGEPSAPALPPAAENVPAPQIELRQPIELKLEQPPSVDDVDLQMEKQETAQIRAMKIETFKVAVNSRTRSQNFNASELQKTPEQAQAAARSDLAAQKAELQRLKAGGADDLFNQRMAQLQMNSGSAPSEIASALGNGGTGNRTLTAFESQTPDPSRWILKSQVLRPAKYSILTGTVIPATLVTGINSDLPGQVTAQVSQNVYDTARGKYLLIPQGARLIGSYSANVIYGQERLLLGWQRIIFPDGRSIDIGSMPGTDQSGYSGINDEVNNHYLRLFGSSLMLSVISAGSAWAADRTSKDTDAQTFSNSFASSAGSNFSQTSTELIRKNMSIAPTLTARPGFRINVMVTKDITVMGEYQDYVY